MRSSKKSASPSLKAKPRAKNGIGTLSERSLHAALKQWYARPGDEIEVPCDGYFVDIVRGDWLIEIQTRNFFALKRKLGKLLENHRLRLVHPIAAEKWIVRVAADGETVLSRRRSPKRGAFEDIFDELVNIPQLLAHPNFSLELLLVNREEIRRVHGGKRIKPRRSRWLKDWEPHDHKLLEVVGQRVIESPSDLLAFLPSNLSDPFTNRDLASALNKPYHLAQQMTYCLRRLELVSIVGKQERSLLYAMSAPQAKQPMNGSRRFAATSG